MALFARARAAATTAEVAVASREALLQALQQATPGTTIRIAPGTYRGGIRSTGLRGTREQPIVITAADEAQPPVFESGWHLSSPQHVELRHLIIQGTTNNGLNIDDGGQRDGSAHHLVLRGLVVQHVGPQGNRDGIKLSGLDDFLVTGCRVRRWGTSGSAIDMVGCHRGVIRECHFAEATGEAAQGVQAKGGSSQIRIQHCRFENPGGRGVNLGGSTGQAFFRPRQADYEARDLTVEDCEFLGGLAAIAFVGVDGAVVRHNTIYRPRYWPIRILQENSDSRMIACRRGRFLHNVVVFRADEIRSVVNIGPGTAPDTFEFGGNWWYCSDRPDETRRLVQLPVPERGGRYGQDPRLTDPERGDLRIEGRQPGAPGRRTDPPSTAPSP